MNKIQQPVYDGKLVTKSKELNYSALPGRSQNLLFFFFFFFFCELFFFDPG